MKRRKIATDRTDLPINRTEWLLTAYRGLLCLYPPVYRTRFAEEMAAVFAEALEEAAAKGEGAIGRLVLRELVDLPRALWHEYGQEAEAWFARRLREEDPMRSDLPGVVPVGYGSLPHLFFVVTGRNPRLRRLFDVAVALFGLFLVSPLLLCLPILITLDSSGPIFYRQQRLGRDGQIYVLYKFRSMVVVSPHGIISPPTTAQGVNPRITRIGRLIRRWHLDEMPQVFNVLKGEMSIFGPRPPMPG